MRKRTPEKLKKEIAIIFRNFVTINGYFCKSETKRANHDKITLLQVQRNEKNNNNKCENDRKYLKYILFIKCNENPSTQFFLFLNK